MIEAERKAKAEGQGKLMYSFAVIEKTRDSGEGVHLWHLGVRANGGHDSERCGVDLETCMHTMTMEECEAFGIISHRPRPMLRTPSLAEVCTWTDVTAPESCGD